MCVHWHSFALNGICSNIVTARAALRGTAECPRLHHSPPWEVLSARLNEHTGTARIQASATQTAGNHLSWSESIP